MACPPQDITDVELAILQLLWDHGPATIRRLTDALYPQGKASHYATVQKLLERLEAKGFVGRDRTQAVHVFSALLSRDELISRRLQSLAEKLCGDKDAAGMRLDELHRKFAQTAGSIRGGDVILAD